MIVIISCIIGILLFIVYNCKTSKEHFSPGTQVQMLTSTPYYNWYDYFSRFRNYFYPSYYSHPIFEQSMFPQLLM